MFPKPFQASLIFVGNKDGAYLKGLLLGFYFTREKPGKDKRSRLFSSITKNKVGVDVIKLFFFIADEEAK